MGNILTRDWKLIKIDVCFALLGVLGPVVLFREAFDDTDLIAPAQNPWLAGAIALAVLIAIGLIAVRLADRDRRASEEYSFQLLANGAVIGIITAMLSSIILGAEFIFGDLLPEPSADTMFALLMSGWALGYFAYRIKGIGA